MQAGSTFMLNIPQLRDEACSLPKPARNSVRKNPKSTIGHPRAPEQAASFALRNIFSVVAVDWTAPRSEAPSGPPLNSATLAAGFMMHSRWEAWK